MRHSIYVFHVILRKNLTSFGTALSPSSFVCRNMASRYLKAAASFQIRLFKVNFRIFSNSFKQYRTLFKLSTHFSLQNVKCAKSSTPYFYRTAYRIVGSVNCFKSKITLVILDKCFKELLFYTNKCVFELQYVPHFNFVQNLSINYLSIPTIP